jgi:hypothetical protein
MEKIMKQLPKRNELWYIKQSNGITVLKIVKDIGVTDLVVLEDYIITDKYNYTSTVYFSLRL